MAVGLRDYWVLTVCYWHCLSRTLDFDSETASAECGASLNKFWSNEIKNFRIRGYRHKKQWFINQWWIWFNNSFLKYALIVTNFGPKKNGDGKTERWNSSIVGKCPSSAGTGKR